jgi:hypothetical protein
MLPDFDRADRIGEFWGNPKTRTFGELLTDCEEDRTLRAVLADAAEGRAFQATGRIGSPRLTTPDLLGASIADWSMREPRRRTEPSAVDPALRDRVARMPQYSRLRIATDSTLSSCRAGAADSTAVLTRRRT